MDDELFTLQSLARPLGLWVGRHLRFDPCRGGGAYYVMPRKTSKDARMPTLRAYLTAEAVEKFLNDYADNYTGEDVVRMVPAARD